MSAKVLITGGAGYVGSHCARAVAQAGFDVTTVDDLSQGHAEAVTGRLVVADLRDRAAMDALLAEGFDAVLHFAARMSVGESVADPIGYVDSNVGGTVCLLAAMQRHGCDALVVSSTCAVYGTPAAVPMNEQTPFAPESPYGETKATIERLLDLAKQAGQLRPACLRYFNAAGASLDGTLGEAHDPETHLIPIALEAASAGHTMTVFGTDHPTRDGTCIRDYVHVEDLARAHVLALRQLLDGSDGGAWNLGTGHGATVREVLDTVQAITGRPVHRAYGPRREGDPPALIADTAHTTRTLGWTAQHSLHDIIRDAWRWHQRPRFGPGATR